MHCAKQRKPYTKEYKLYDSFYVKFKNRQNTAKIRTLISFGERMGLIRRGTKTRTKINFSRIYIPELESGVRPQKAEMVENMAMVRDSGARSSST